MIMPQRQSCVVVDAAIDSRRTLFDPRTSRYFRLGEREAAFYESLDSSRSLDALRVSGEQSFAPQEIDTLITWFQKNGLLEGTPAETETRPRVWWRHILDRVCHPERWRFRIDDPDAFLDRHRHAINIMFSRGALGVYLLLLLAPIFALGLAPHVLSDAVLTYRLPTKGSTWITLIAMLLVMNVIHETAHAVACKHFGGQVRSIGIMIFYLYPVMFCDVSAAWRFDSRRAKVLVSLAGLFSQALLASITLGVWMVLREPVLLNFIAVNVSIAVFNFFPFVKLDGYWILVHLVNEPSLTKKGLMQVDRLIRRAILDKNKTNEPYRPWLLAFGLGHIVSAPLFWVMGIFALHRYGAMISPTFGTAIASVAASVLAARGVHALVGYGKTLTNRHASAI